ncbi:MAG: hypothetical protein QXS20_08185, partial [Candidatus Thorarchaeota archaeon]
MLSAVSYKIYELRRYLVLSLVISIIAIPLGNVLVIQRDRNRCEMYGEAFWLYGFAVYNMTDHELVSMLPPEWGFDDGEHVLPDYLGNITYEYPVFGLIFFAVAVWLFPGVNDLQPLWLNFLLTLVFHLNIVLIALLFGDKIYTTRWVRLFIAGYYVYGLITSAGGGKLEPLADCLLLMSLVLRQEGQRNKAMFTLGLAVQTKVYPAVAFPLLFIEAPLSSLWFFVSMLLTAIPFLFQGLNLDSLISHILNTESYSPQIVNTIYPGLAFGTPVIDEHIEYVWPPALIPLVLYVGFMLYTINVVLPNAKAFREPSWKNRLLLLKPLYLYLLPGTLFIFRWVMPWYLFWFGILLFLNDTERQSVAFLKLVTIVGLLYAMGLFC